MVHGALQQSLESLRRFVEDGIPGMPAEPRRTSRLVRMVAFRARDETVDAATCFVFPGLSRCAAWIRCEDLGHAFWSLGGWRLAGADGCDPDGALGPEPAGERPLSR